MYVGIDLSHVITNDGIKSSTVAVVASADHIPNRYYKEVYYQKRSNDDRNKSIESIIHLKEIFKSLIRQYYEDQKSPPKAIIIYRDGISNSEFQTVFEQELQAIRNACTELAPVYRPYLTYIVVNKRHHTRVLTEGSTPSNPPQGTTTDSQDINVGIKYNFYLISHEALKVR